MYVMYVALTQLSKFYTIYQAYRKASSSLDPRNYHSFQCTTLKELWGYMQTAQTPIRMFTNTLILHFLSHVIFRLCTCKQRSSQDCQTRHAHYIYISKFRNFKCKPSLDSVSDLDIYFLQEDIWFSKARQSGHDLPMT